MADEEETLEQRCERLKKDVRHYESEAVRLTNDFTEVSDVSRENRNKLDLIHRRGRDYLEEKVESVKSALYDKAGDITKALESFREALRVGSNIIGMSREDLRGYAFAVGNLVRAYSLSLVPEEEK